MQNPVHHIPVIACVLSFIEHRGERCYVQLLCCCCCRSLLMFPLLPAYLRTGIPLDSTASLPLGFALLFLLLLRCLPYLAPLVFFQRTLFDAALRLLSTCVFTLLSLYRFYDAPSTSPLPITSWSMHTDKSIMVSCVTTLITTSQHCA